MHCIGYKSNNVNTLNIGLKRVVLFSQMSRLAGVCTGRVNVYVSAARASMCRLGAEAALQRDEPRGSAGSSSALQVSPTLQRRIFRLFMLSELERI